MTHLAHRLRQVTVDLMRLRIDLEVAMANNSGEVSELTSGGRRIVEEFKSALDEARHTVWPLVLAAEQQAEGNAGYALQMYRMERIRRMLVALTPSAADARTQLFLAEVRKLSSRSD